MVVCGNSYFSSFKLIVVKNAAILVSQTSGLNARPYFPFHFNNHLIPISNKSVTVNGEFCKHVTINIRLRKFMGCEVVTKKVIYSILHSPKMRDEPF